jgi:preprotein translocase subunit SecF
MKSDRKYIAFMKYKWLYFAISVLLMLPGLYFLLRHGLRLSIDFTGGTLLEVQTQKQISADDIRRISAPLGFDISSIQPSSDNVYVIRLKAISQDQYNQFKTLLASSSGEVIDKRFETVGPLVGAEMTRNALISVLVASLFIIIYIAWSFRSIPKPYSSWKFGSSAVIALVHDVFMVVGMFSLFGEIWGVEIDSLFVTALLTIIGFSVHDSIVVFDRVRENLVKLPRATFEQVVDFSITETLVRSLNTSLTVTLTLTSLLLFGGETIRWFVAALLVGIISGTYSSIFNAAPILVLWETRNQSDHNR